MPRGLLTKPELVHLEGNALQPTRPSGSGDLQGHRPGRSDSGLALIAKDENDCAAHAIEEKFRTGLRR
jgi:hypothetical protein